MLIYSENYGDSSFGSSCCFTGYRPIKFPFSIEQGSGGLKRLENSIIETVFSLYAEGCTTFYSGMAMGFDIIAAEAVLLLKEEHSEVRLICAVPFKEQGAGFPEPWHGRYAEIIRCADEVVITADKYYKGCYHKRNAFLVDSSDFVVTWFDGQPGGTAWTVKYAQNKGRYVLNLNNGCNMPAERLRDIAYCC